MPSETVIALISINISDDLWCLFAREYGALVLYGSILRTVSLTGALDGRLVSGLPSSELPKAAI